MSELYLQGISVEELIARIRQSTDEANQTDHRRSTSEPKQEKYLTRYEVANRFNISLPTLTRYTKERNIPTYKLGRKYLYKESEIELLLTSIAEIKYKKKPETELSKILKGRRKS